MTALFIGVALTFGGLLVFDDSDNRQSLGGMIIVSALAAIAAVGIWGH